MIGRAVGGSAVLACPQPRPTGPEACRSPATGRHDDLPYRLGHHQGVLASGHRSGDSVSLVLVHACRDAVQAESCQTLASSGRASPGAPLAVPASPRGSGEDLDHLDIARDEGAEQNPPLDDPGIVGACQQTALIRCPADAADRPGELELALASWSSPLRAVCPTGAQERGLSIAVTIGEYSTTRSTTCWHVK